jgi:hypothetical protein
MMHIDSRNQHSGSSTSRRRQWRARRKLPPNPPKVKHRRPLALNPDASLSFDERDNDACAPRDKNVLDGCVDSVAALLFDGCAAIAGRSRHDSSAVRGHSGYIVDPAKFLFRRCSNGVARRHHIQGNQQAVQQMP